MLPAQGYYVVSVRYGEDGKPTIDSFMFPQGYENTKRGHSLPYATLTEAQQAQSVILTEECGTATPQSSLADTYRKKTGRDLEILELKLVSCSLE